MTFFFFLSAQCSRTGSCDHKYYFFLFSTNFGLSSLSFFSSALGHGLLLVYLYNMEEMLSQSHFFVSVSLWLGQPLSSHWLMKSPRHSNKNRVLLSTQPIHFMVLLYTTCGICKKCILWSALVHSRSEKSIFNCVFNELITPSTW